MSEEDVLVGEEQVLDELDEVRALLRQLAHHCDDEQRGFDPNLLRGVADPQAVLYLSKHWELSGDIFDVIARDRELDAVHRQLDGQRERAINVVAEGLKQLRSCGFVYLRGLKVI